MLSLRKKRKMTILIQTEKFELGDLYAHLNQQKLPKGVTVKLDTIEKTGRVSTHEVFQFIFEIWDNDWPEGIREMVKYSYEKMLEIVLAKPHVEVTFTTGDQPELLHHTMSESAIAARLIELVETGTVKSIRFNS